jgi:hypothetical protein
MQKHGDSEGTKEVVLSLGPGGWYQGLWFKVHRYLWKNRWRTISTRRKDLTSTVSAQLNSRSGSRESRLSRVMRPPFGWSSIVTLADMLLRTIVLINRQYLSDWVHDGAARDVIGWRYIDLPQQHARLPRGPQSSRS